MAKKRETPGVLDTISGNEPLVLVGEPSRMRGTLNLTNAGDQEILLEGARLRTISAQRARGKTAAPLLEINHPLHPIIVRPGRSRSVAVKMALDPYTPPGEYDAELEVGGETKPVKVHVIEKVQLSLYPERLILREVPGTSTTKRIVVRNDGNVPLTIGEIGAVVLEDEQLQCRILRRVVAAIDSGDKAEFEDYFRVLIAQAQGVLAEAGALRVHNQPGRVVVAPGATEPIDLEIQLPASLDKRTRYIASVPLYNRDLIFEVNPVLGDHSDKRTR